MTPHYSTLCWMVTCSCSRAGVGEAPVMFGRGVTTHPELVWKSLEIQVTFSRTIDFFLLSWHVFFSHTDVSGPHLWNFLPSIGFSRPSYIAEIFIAWFSGSSSGLSLILQMDQGLVYNSQPICWLHFSGFLGYISGVMTCKFPVKRHKYKNLTDVFCIASS